MLRLLAALLLLVVCSSWAMAQSSQNSFPLDHKLAHVGAGFAISWTVGYATNHPWTGLVSGFGAGVTKEVWDSRHGNATFGMHAADVAITTAGSALAYWVVKKMIAAERHHNQGARALPATP